MVANDWKDTRQALHTDAVYKAVKSHERKVVLDGRPPPIRNSEKDLTKKERSNLAQLRSEYGGLLDTYKSRINKYASLTICDMIPHDVNHIFGCLDPVYNGSVRFMEYTDGRKLRYFEARDPD